MKSCAKTPCHQFPLNKISSLRIQKQCIPILIHLESQKSESRMIRIEKDAWVGTESNDVNKH